MSVGKISNLKEKNFHEKDVLYFQTGSLQINNPGMAPLHIDGDHAPTDKKFNIEILPAAFTLLTP